MIDILTQIANNNVEYLVGGGGLTAMGIMVWITKRTLNKVMNHVENPDVHVDKKNGYVNRTMCDIIHKQQTKNMETVQRDMMEIKRDVKTLLRK